MLTALCLLGVSVVQAQNMVVYLANGTRTTLAVSAIDSIRFEPTTINGHDYVDLGLSVLWATCNVGAKEVTDYGKYYAWGETTTKRDYSKSRYRYFEADRYQSIGEEIDGTRYDVASTTWRDGWRMPTLDEARELIEKCTWTRTALEGVNGYRVQGPSGASIFLPAAGMYYGTSLEEVGEKGYYWSGTQAEGVLSMAHTINFSGNDGEWTANRAYGFTIRPVHAR